MQHLADEELIAQFRSGNHLPENDRYLNELFNRYVDRVAMWCWRYTGDRELASDLAQEVFVRVFERLDTFQGSSRFSTWLYTVVRNHCINAMTSRVARQREATEPMVTEPEDASRTSVEEVLIQEDQIERIRRLMVELLDATERRVMVMHYCEGMRLEDVTRFLGLQNASGAKAYIVSARRKLKRAFERQKSVD